MQKSTYNIFLTMAQIAAKNVQKTLEEQYDRDIYGIEVTLRDDDDAVALVASIVKHQSIAVKAYTKSAARALDISAERSFDMYLSPGAVFVNSVLRSNRMRVYQKRLLELYSARIYLDMARKYENEHPRSESVEFAKTVLVDMYSFEFLSHFRITADKISIDSSFLDTMVNSACDPDYTNVTNRMLLKKAGSYYKKIFMARNDVFLQPFSEKSAPAPMPKMSEEKSEAFFEKPLLARTAKATKEKIASVSTSVYRGILAFAKKKKPVAFDLDMKHVDINRCPESRLIEKKQFAEIEAMTKHTFIFACFDDAMPQGLDNAGVIRYYYGCECRMYCIICGLKENSMIRKKGNVLYFPDGKQMVIEPGMKAYEFLHKVNIMNAAVFGIDPMSLRSSEWMNGILRQAYVDEGNAEYRLHMIERRARN